MLSKSSIHFSVDGRGCVYSLLFDLRPNYSGGNEDKGDLLQNVPCMHCYTQCPHRCSRPPPTQTSTGVSWILTGKSTSNLHLFWGHCSFFLGPGEHKILFVPSKNLYSQSYVSSGNSMVGLMAISSKRAYAIPRSAVPRLPEERCTEARSAARRQRTRPSQRKRKAGRQSGDLRRLYK